jgi:hypothetical protein
LFGENLKLELTSSGQYCIGILGNDNSNEADNVMYSADIKDEQLFITLQEVVNGCETCVKFKKSPARPVVGLPQASDFNETVAVDLHIT